MIDHCTVANLLRITMLVYNYGNSIIVDSKDETIETFVNNASVNKLIDSLQISDVRRQVLFDIAKATPNGKVFKFISDKTTDIQVGITTNEDDKRICVVFRGSESNTDWMYDLQVRKHKLTDDISVHSGFYKQLHDTDVYTRIVDELRILWDKFPDYSVYITGHSLGAALATLFGYLLSHEVENKITVVSFASPRVGNANWQKSFEAKTNLVHYRVTNNRDIITAFPVYKYKHVGQNIRLFENTFSTFDNYEDDSWYDFTIFRCWSAKDHNCELYYKNLIHNKW